LQAAALADAIEHFDISVLLGLSSAGGRDILARLAALTDAPLVQDCIGIDLAAKTVTKSHFSGKTLATIKFNSNPYICGLRPNALKFRQHPAMPKSSATRLTCRIRQSLWLRKSSRAGRRKWI
jgi:electron transfer flavoprotein alpha subunit